MVNLVFSKTGNTPLHVALDALNRECLDVFPNTELYSRIANIAVIELSQYKTLLDLVNYLFRIKVVSPSTSVLLALAEEQVVPPLKCGAVKLSDPVSVWKNSLTILKRGGPNIDSVVKECMALMRYHLLSPKQIRVIECLGEGLSPNEIAKRLLLSVKTVYAYISYASNEYGFSTSKKFRRYVISEKVISVARPPEIMLRLPLNEHIAR